MSRSAPTQPEHASATDGQLFESAFRFAAIGMALVELDGRWSKVNDALCRIIGYSREELLAIDFQTITHPEDLDADLSLVRQLLAGEIESYTLKKRYLRKSGSHVWVDLSATLVRSNRGEPLFFIAQIQDISARVNQEWEQHWLASLVESSNDAVVGLDNAGRVLSWNAGAEALYGYSAAEMIGKGNDALVPPGQSNELYVALRDAPPETRTVKFDAQRRRKDGQLIDVNVSASRVCDEEGRALGWAVIGRDATEAKRLRRALERRVDTYTAIARSLPLGSVSMFDRELRYLAAEGPELFALFNTSSEAIVGRKVGETASVANRDALLTLCRAALAGNVAETELALAGHTMLLRTSPVVGQNQEIVAGIILCLDVTDRVARDQELKRTKLLLEATFSNIRDGVVLLDGQRSILIANEAYRRLLAVTRPDVVGMTFEEFSAHLREIAYEPETVSEGLSSTDDRQLARPSEFLLKSPRRWLRRTITPIDAGQERFYLAVWSDVTAERDQIAEREREVLTDVLTGIPNRRAAESALSAAARLEKCCIALFDIDHFKRVNDRYGHAAGDDVLKRVAGALVGQARSKDLVARWGGEEFVAVLETDLAGAQIFCERARGRIAALDCGDAGRVTISVGVVEHDPRRASSESMERADRALYQAKQGGRNRVVAG